MWQRMFDRSMQAPCWQFIWCPYRHHHSVSPTVCCHWALLRALLELGNPCNEKEMAAVSLDVEHASLFPCPQQNSQAMARWKDSLAGKCMRRYP